MKENKSKKIEIISLKLEEMRFQYKEVVNNYSRLISKCTFSMLVMSVFFGGIINYFSKKDVYIKSCIHINYLLVILFFLLIISLLIISLFYIVYILIHTNQFFINHEQFSEIELSSEEDLVEKMISSYYRILTKLKYEVTNAQKKYKISLISLFLSIVCFLLYYGICFILME